MFYIQSKLEIMKTYVHAVQGVFHTLHKSRSCS